MPDSTTARTTSPATTIGTPRMATSWRDGVVDADGRRVLDHPDLFIAGSGVFRTSGYANPTLTIVQMALRMADHLLAARS
jgi:choline dehydrogenase-like flavoprotein